MNGIASLTDPREVVAAKRDRHEVDPGALRAFVLGYARGDVDDHVAAAFLMAAYLNGLTGRETAALTEAMIASGRTIALPELGRPRIDKHSTGGVSDGVTLVFAPLAASLGLAVAKLSGRGLGHTGGTLDKLESIPGFRTDLSPEALEGQVRDVGCAVAAQSADLVPADGALYALREATATIGSVPLIAASVMSKKLAVGTDLIVLDVKAGSGAFMKDPGAASELARACLSLAETSDRRCVAAVTDMSQPLGTAVGNAIEIREAVRILRGEERGRVAELAATFAGVALEETAGVPAAEALNRASTALADGTAAETFARMVEAQGGDPRVVEDPEGVLPVAPVRRDVAAPRRGFLTGVDAEAVGMAVVALGGGRKRKGDAIDPSVGIAFNVSIGDGVGDAPLATVWARTEDEADAATARLAGAVTLAEAPVEPPPLVHGWHGRNR